MWHPKLEDSGEVIVGKIGPNIVDPGVINHHLGKPLEIRLMETRVGQGRPRYVIKELPAMATNTRGTL